MTEPEFRTALLRTCRALGDAREWLMYLRDGLSPADAEFVKGLADHVQITREQVRDLKQAAPPAGGEETS